MNSIFKGDVNTAQGRALAWIDSLFIDHAIFRLAIGNFDTVTLLSVVMLTALAVVLFSALIDIMYAVLDPRIRLG